MKRLPTERFDIPLWKEAKVHPDHHIVFDKSYYSLPTRYIGKKVWARGGLNDVKIFYEGEQIKTHGRSYRKGSWVTDERDYPPEKSKYLLKTTSYYRKQAFKYGKHVCRLITTIMTEHAYRNLRKVQALFRLADKYGYQELDLTCRRCLFFEDYRMTTIKRILKEKLYLLPLGDDSPEGASTGCQQTLTFLRPSNYFVHRKEEIQ
jgi:hypothetical protein